MEKERAASDVDEEGLEQLTEDYDRYYKYKHLDNNVFPESMKGRNLTLYKCVLYVKIFWNH